MKCVNNLILTLVASKSSIPWVPKSHSPETNAILAIRHKKIIKRMFVLIPVIHEDKCYINCLGPFLPLSHWTQRPTVMVHRMFSQSFHRLKTGRNLDVDFKWVQIFFASSYAKFHVQITERTEGFKQLHRHYLIIRGIFGK